jgi:nucleoside-diphosphate-sugar epimerase
VSKQILVVTGGSGYLGRHLTMKAVERFEVYATYYPHAGRIKAGRPVPLDLTNREEVFRVIAGAKPKRFCTWCFPAWMMY